MKNIYLERIRRDLLLVSQYFDPAKSSYAILKSCSSSQDATTMLENLYKLGSTKDYPDSFRDFFQETENMLKALIEIDKKIENTQNQINEKYNELEKEFEKRGIKYDNEFYLDNNYKDLSYVQKKEYLEKLEKQLQKVDIALDDGIKKEKELGQKFNEKLEEMTNSEDNNEKSKLQNIQKNAEDNYKIVSNPDEKFVTTLIEYFRSNQKEESKLNINIEYKGDSVELNIGYKGKVVNEQDSLYKCVYSDMDYFNKEIKPILIEEHILESETNSKLEDGKLTSENELGESLEVTGNEDEAIEIQQEINYYIDSKTKERKNTNQKVRKLTPYNKAFSNITIFIIIFIILILTLLVILLILNLK